MGGLNAPPKGSLRGILKRVKERLRLSYKPLPLPLIKGKGIKGMGLKQLIIP
jgi:hypothetical protein